MIGVLACGCSSTSTLALGGIGVAALSRRRDVT
jgi:uncharacterized protein (TIGR03382 family)